MSIQLNQGTIPDNLRVASQGVMTGYMVFIGEYEVSMEDFSAMVLYVLTNTDLEENDPRIELVKNIKNLMITTGWNEGGVRFKRLDS